MMQLAAMSKYESYKDSGVEWIGGVPSDWQLLANKFVFRLKKETVGKRSPDYDLLSLTLRGVIKRDMENPEGKFPAEFDTYQAVAKGDFVFCHFDVEETPRTVGLSDHAGMITGAYTIYDVVIEANKKFLFYFYLNADTDKKMRGLYKGLRNTIPKESFKSFKVPWPPLKTQNAIAVFLDEKTAKINEAIAIKERQIALLKERKQIIIQDAVTKGLNPDAPMKDSGVDWIGQIPAHWEVSRLGFKGRFQNGISRGGEFFGSGNPFATYGDIFNNAVLPKKLSGLAKSSEADRSLYSVKRNDVFFTRTSEVADEIGIASVCLEDARDATFSGFIIRFRPAQETFVSSYSMYLYRSQYVRDFFAHEMNIVIRASLAQDLLKQLPLFVPPIDEQIQIADHLLYECGKIEVCLETEVAQIAKLKEYKMTLINNAVTGKIKVA